MASNGKKILRLDGNFVAKVERLASGGVAGVGARYRTRRTTLEDIAKEIVIEAERITDLPARDGRGRDRGRIRRGARVLHARRELGTCLPCRANDHDRSSGHAHAPRPASLQARARGHVRSRDRARAPPHARLGRASPRARGRDRNSARARGRSRHGRARGHAHGLGDGRVRASPPSFQIFASQCS